MRQTCAHWLLRMDDTVPARRFGVHMSNWYVLYRTLCYKYSPSRRPSMPCMITYMWNGLGQVVNSVRFGLSVIVHCNITPLFGSAKRFFEPPYVRRSWLTWWYDTSKQGIGAIVIHMTNVYLAPMFQGDPCTWWVTLQTTNVCTLNTNKSQRLQIVFFSNANNIFINIFSINKRSHACDAQFWWR